MDVKGALFLIGFCFLTVSNVWCETIPEKTEEPAKVEAESPAAPAQPDPYKDVTWNSVRDKQQDQTSSVTVYSPRTRGADVYTVTSTNGGVGPQTGVVMAAPVAKRSRRWWFWS